MSLAECNIHILLCMCYSCIDIRYTVDLPGYKVDCDSFVTDCDEETHVRCEDGVCLINGLWCDSVENCPDGSDEHPACYQGVVLAFYHHMLQFLKLWC